MKLPIQSLRDGDPKSFQGWALKGLIGEGGQSTIYLAEKNGQRAALKMIRKEYLHDSKSVNRFFTEIKNLELLDHPNIARLLEVEDSGKFLAIEFIEGPNLEDYVNNYGPLGFKTWSSLAQSLAITIDYCHSRGIVHKDISPKNIVMGENGPMLIDFGISYLEKDPRLTSDDETIGTPPFMSPEHFGISTPKEMDNFSLGGTLIFAGTGHYPFNGDKKSEWKESILYDRPNFNGLTENQQILLSPLLYKDPEKRQTLATFTKLVALIDSTEVLDEFSLKQIARIKQNSNSLLIKQKKNLNTNRRIGKKIFTLAAIVSLLSITLVAFGITAIQKNQSGEMTRLTTPTVKQTQTPTLINPSIEPGDPNPSITPTTKSSTQTSKSTAPTKSQAPATPSPTKQASPVLSSENFKVSAPVASNVIKDSIFGRAFEDGLHFWHIGLTNSKSEKVPAITSIQFRMIGYPNAGWMDVPYKLKTESTFGTVYAEVDDMLFALIFKEVKYCPEFRAVREENGKIVQIWEKGQPECANDYVP